MLRNIYVSGAASTGKTTLIKALQKYFASNGDYPAPKIIAEVARRVMTAYPMESREQIRSNPEKSLQLQKRILEAQLEAEKRVLGLGDSPNGASKVENELRWFISDRSCLDPVMYTKIYVTNSHQGSIPIPNAVEEITASPTYLALEERLRKGILVLIEPNEVTLTDDGVRLMPNNLKEWKLFHEVSSGFLKDRGIKYLEIGKELCVVEERMMFVVKAWMEKCQAKDE
ncbi:AAA domain-containing protein [Kalaharituber pfeilii]|nr:AAA domain-containing protein [Kalaharituber pfeilii]